MTDPFLPLALAERWTDALHLDLLLRLLLAAVLGGLIGLEREIAGKPAGLRTNLLICVGATLLMDLSLAVATAANVVNAQQGVAMRADPARIAAQIVSGIGFLGAGTILQSRGNVTGLTTAATIWVVAAIGMAVGAGAFAEAIGSAVLVMGSLALLGRVEMIIVRRRQSRRYVLTLSPDPALVAEIRVAFRRRGLKVETESLDKGELFETSFEVSGPHRAHEYVLAELAGRPGVRRMTRVS